jgi:endonuclease/exonuclease/phosphatase family metal-dependent hydrolase
MIKRKLIFIFTILSVCVNLHASTDTLMIMSYNILNYGSNNSRDEHFRKVIAETKPDILVVQEIMSQSAVDNFLSNVLNSVFPLTYSAGVFINGPDTDNAIFFNNAKIKFIRNFPVKTALRDINEFTILPVNGYDTLRIYSVHLKASNTSTDRLKRAAEVDSLRKVTNSFSPGNHFIVLGDFNIYGSTEMAYQKLVEVQVENDGNFYDPFNMTGVWNDFAYAQFHTQSPRTRSFGGGATGGLDDRFDMILYSSSVKDPGGITFIEGSTVAFGNDGNHYNDSINKIPNTAVTHEVANALHYASDHLPVYALFTYENNTSSISGNITASEMGYTLYPNYPNPFNSSTTISFSLPFSSEVSFRVYNNLGSEVKDLSEKISFPSGTFSKILNFNNMNSGVYYLRMETYDPVENKKINLSTKLLLLK